jgi:anion-transporting  ArsA/GET3 family ATPase
VTPLAARLEGKRVVIVAGSGGVGKTTASAALALGLAASGARVAVVTIDPARRLAESLGLEQLGNEPRRVPADLLEAAAPDMRMQGELWAMMLDPKATFDELMVRLSPDAKTRDEVLGNRIYRELSGAVAGTQEFSAIAKLYELYHEGGFDVLVLDTPPSRNALDFLDAPDRLTDFFEGRALRVLLAPTGVTGRLLGAGTSVVFSLLKRITGVDLLGDIAVFFRSLGGLIDGFKARAAAVKALLADRETTFLIVTSPEREPVAEAIFFREQLRAARMAFGALIVNRVEVLDEEPGTPEDLRGNLRDALGAALAGKVADTVADAQLLAARHKASIEQLMTRLDEHDPIVVPRLDGDITDVAGLLALYRRLAEA